MRKMGALAFDTLAYSQELQAAGVPEKQANAQAHALAGVVTETLATKGDIADLKQAMQEMEVSLQRDMKESEAGLRRDMQEMETNLRRDMQEMETNLRRDTQEMETNLRRDTQEVEQRLKYDLTVRLGTMMAISVGLVAALVKLL